MDGWIYGFGRTDTIPSAQIFIFYQHDDVRTYFNDEDTRMTANMDIREGETREVR